MFASTVGKYITITIWHLNYANEQEMKLESTACAYSKIWKKCGKKNCFYLWHTLSIRMLPAVNCYWNVPTHTYVYRDGNGFDQILYIFCLILMEI